MSCRCNIVGYHYRIGMGLWKMVNIQVFKNRKVFHRFELNTCEDRFRSIDLAHPNRESAREVRSLDVHWSRKYWYDIWHPIFCALWLDPRPAFCRIRKESFGIHRPSRNRSSSIRPWPSRDCRQRCSLFEWGHICDCSPTLHIHSREHVPCKH